jgi:uncharacterized membrane protein YkvA (DUF1232 family)
MTELHDRVRATLHEMAEEIPRTPMLPRLDRHADQARWRDRLLVAAAVVAVIAATVGVAVLVRQPDASEPAPAVRPPNVFHVTGIVTTRPGIATLAVVVGGNQSRIVEDAPAYVIPAAGGAALTVPGGSDIHPTLQRLSADGSLLLREGPTADAATVLDLRTGKAREYVVGIGLVEELAPDNQRIASYIDRGVLVTDLATGRTTTVRSAGSAEERGGLGWSPDGRQLALHEPGGTRIVDENGRTLERLPALTLVNGSMSWSPSGRYVLAYDEEAGGFVRASTDGEERSAIDKPAPERPAPGLDRPAARLARRQRWDTAPGHDRRGRPRHRRLDALPSRPATSPERQLGTCAQRLGQPVGSPPQDGPGRLRGNPGGRGDLSWGGRAVHGARTWIIGERVKSTKSRLAVVGVLWRILRNQRAGEAGLGARFASLPRLLRSSITGRYAGLKPSRIALWVLAVVYLLSPIDLVPEAFLGPLGLADDLGVAAWLASTVLVETDRFLQWESAARRVVPGTVVRP